MFFKKEHIAGDYGNSMPESFPAKCHLLCFSLYQSLPAPYVKIADLNRIVLTARYL